MFNEIQEMKLIFFADVPPNLTDESIKAYLECGFTVYLMTEDHIDYDADRDKYLELLGRLNSSGVKILVRGYNDGKAVPDYFNKFADVDFHAYKNVIGFYLVDEPACENINGVNKYCIPFYNQYNNLLWHINLLPSYTPKEALVPEQANVQEPFEYYVNEYVEKVIDNVCGPKDICFDHYALFNKDSVYYISDTWLYDLTVVASAAKKSGAIMGACVQAFSEPGWRVYTSVNEIRFQLYTFLAFGVRIFEFYHYCPLSTFPNAVSVCVNGKPTFVYDYCKAAIKEIKKAQDIYIKYEWQGIYFNQGKAVVRSANYVHIENCACSEFGVGWENGENPAFAKIENKSLKSLKMMEIESEKDIIVGEFKNSDGEYAYMIVNFSEPAIESENNVKISFVGGGKRISLTDKGSTIKFTESEISIKLKSGDGIFITVSEE